MIETIRLIAAGAAAVLFLIAGVRRMRSGSYERMNADLLRIGRFTAAGAVAAAVAFAGEVAHHFWPTF